MANKPSKKNNEHSKKLILILTGVTVLVALGVYIHVNSDNQNKSVETFFENRKSVEAYQEYRDKDDAKRKAEKNIFLQN